MMEEEFLKWMDWFGKTHSEFDITLGDICDDSFRQRLEEATYVFIEERMSLFNNVVIHNYIFDVIKWTCVFLYRIVFVNNSSFEPQLNDEVSNLLNI